MVLATERDDILAGRVEEFSGAADEDRRNWYKRFIVADLASVFANFRVRLVLLLMLLIDLFWYSNCSFEFRDFTRLSKNVIIPINWYELSSWSLIIWFS